MNKLRQKKGRKLKRKEIKKEGNQKGRKSNRKEIKKEGNQIGSNEGKYGSIGAFGWGTLRS